MRRDTVVDISGRRGIEAAGGAATAAPHPEEMRATLDLKIGDSVAISATARATPAGLVAVALIVSATLIPLLMLYKAPGRDAARKR